MEQFSRLFSVRLLILCKSITSVLKSNAYKDRHISYILKDGGIPSFTSERILYLQEYIQPVVDLVLPCNTFRMLVLSTIVIFFGQRQLMFQNTYKKKQLQIQNVKHHCCMNRTALEKTKIYKEQVFEGKYIFAPSLELNEDILEDLSKLKACASMTELRCLKAEFLFE